MRRARKKVSRMKNNSKKKEAAGDDEEERTMSGASCCRFAAICRTNTFRNASCFVSSALLVEGAGRAGRARSSRIRPTAAVISRQLGEIASKLVEKSFDMWKSAEKEW